MASASNPDLTLFRSTIRSYSIDQVRPVLQALFGARRKDLNTWRLVENYCEAFNVEQRSSVLSALSNARGRRLPYSRNGQSSRNDTLAPLVLKLRCYTVRQVQTVLRRLFQVTTRQVTSRSQVEQFCLELDATHQASVLQQLENPVQFMPGQPSENGNLPSHAGPQGNLVEGEREGEDAHGNSSSCPQSEYLKCVDQATIDECVAEYIDHTNNESFSRDICASCSRLQFTQQLEVIRIVDIPNSDLLRPAHAHPQHHLFQGMLLAVQPTDEDASVFLCQECLSRLRREKRPKLSLANGLWIGEIPVVLRGLTLPERLLISLYFPAAYVVKLYPSGRRSLNWQQDRLQSGLKGNVSTYRLDQQQIAGMVGLTMPPPARLLSATIAVTYVGSNNLPKRSLPGTFRVRRSKVAAALAWLKEHNPLYANIDISSDRLGQLPLDAVPTEIEDVTRWSDDVDRLTREHASYVPLNDQTTDDDLNRLQAQDAMIVDEANPRDDDTMDMDVTEPSVIPLQALGVIDTAGHDIPSDELFTHALANTAGIDRRPHPHAEYAIRHGSAFVNEYARKDPVTGLRFDGGPDNPNHLLGTFPFLFPYGVGGFETGQEEPVSYEAHARWALEYADRRFRKDILFIFQVFGVIQKRHVCRASVLQLKSAPDVVQQQLRSLKVNDFVKACEEEARKIPFSNPAIRTLRSQMTALRARVPGTDESRHSIRGKIWGTNLLYNSPTLWVTINLPDVADPIAQVLAGEDIDLDAFCRTAGPDAIARGINIAEDPFAGAQYFHTVIRKILESLFGITANGSGQRIRRKDGIFGAVQAYIGTVEAQGRGTLHLHLLLWLRDTPGPVQFKELLKDEAFRSRIADFIRQNIHADIDSKTTEELLQTSPDKEIGYTRPIDPRKPDYIQQREVRIRTVARSLQFHGCRDNVCRVVKQGKVVCKRGAPWAMARDAWVTEAGFWGPKRLSGFVNNFNPTLASTLSCNHDVKIILQGTGTRNVSWYITNYATKKQQHTSNATALMAKRFAFSEKEHTLNADLLDANKKLLQRCANAITRDREFSAPEVVSYLMGWGDRYESHFYVTVRWDMAFSALLKAYPGLKAQSQRHMDLSSNGTGQSTSTMTEELPESYTLQFVGDQLELKNQLREYAHRGEELSGESFLRVLLDTYDAPSTPDVDIVSANAEGTHRQARPRHQRIPYLESYGNAQRCRIKRATRHETLPRIVGRWFPRNDDDQAHELYCASMLLLLAPWRSLRDLKREDQTFREVFASFYDNADAWVRTVVSNIQHYYDCSDDAKADVGEVDNSMRYAGMLEEDVREQFGIQLPHEIDPTEGLTEDHVTRARETRLEQREQDYIDGAIMIAEHSNINCLTGLPAEELEAIVERSSPDALGLISTWERTLKAITRENGHLTEPVDLRDTAAVLQSTLLGATDQETAAQVSEVVQRVAASDGEGGLKSILNPEQRRAHDIIVTCVSNDLQGVPQPQLLMIVHGQGGTGKTLLIQAVSETLRQMKALEYLGKAATSGIAACPIGGSTVHTYFGIPINVRERDWISKGNEAMKKRRVENIAKKKIVFIDEMSMLTKSTLCNISEVCQTVRAESGEGTSNSTLPFGGLHIVLFGDLHQFPPVAAPTHALYVECLDDKNERSSIGRIIFKQFNVVVFLVEQNRSRDRGWTAILDRSRVGECTDDDLDEVDKLSLTDPRCDIPDFTEPAWKEALLITPRHSLREEWNRRTLHRFCYEGGRRRYVLQAQDIDKLTGEIPRIDWRVAVAGMKWKQTGRLSDRIEIAKGMKVMVLMNLATEADVANGTRGVIEDFWLHPLEESQEMEDGSVLLSHLPPVIFFRPNEPTNARFPNVEPGLIPITPSSVTFEVRKGRSKAPFIRVKRTQYAITGAYAFTDYKSQGQTIEKVLIDLHKPPSGHKLSEFSAYVALSRGRGRDSIRLLRPVDPKLLTTHPSEDLRREMARLQALDRDTTAWWGRLRGDGSGESNMGETVRGPDL